MAGTAILVLGGTGPAGICLLRELLHRGHTTIAYVRNPAKIPDELKSNSLLTVVEGELGNTTALSSAISQCSVVLSLLGPQATDLTINPSFFADIYKKNIFPLMRQHQVKRIFAMGTVSIQIPQDHWTLSQFMIRPLMRLFASNLFRNMINLADTFEQDAEGLDWTIFRIGAIPGQPDEKSWRKDREGAHIFTGYIGEKGWTMSLKRAWLAQWLADAAEGKADAWIGKMPAIGAHA